MLSGDHPLLDGALHHRAGRAPHLARAPRRPSPRASSRTRASTGASCAAPTATSSASSRPRTPATRRPRSSRSRRSTPAPTPSRSGRCSRRSRGVRRRQLPGRVYLGDVLPLLRAAGHTRRRAPDRRRGGRPRRQHARRPGAWSRPRPSARILERHMLAGVTITDPASTVIDADVTDRRGHDDRALQRSCAGQRRGRRRLHGRPDDDADRLRARRRRARRALLPAGVRGAGRAARSGPFTHLRPGHEAAARARRPARSSRSRTPTSGAGAKVPHLSYIGDADLGEGTNIGAGTITANYDGAQQAPHA